MNPYVILPAMIYNDFKINFSPVKALYSSIVKKIGTAKVQFSII